MQKILKNTIGCTKALGILLLLTVVASFPSTSIAQEWGTLKGKFIYDGVAPAPIEWKCNVKIDKDQKTCCAVKHIDESLLVDKDGGLANVIIWLRSKPKAIHPGYAADAKGTVTLDNKDCKFTPRAFGVRIGQTLEIANSDNVQHNSKGPGFNPLISPDTSTKQTPKSATLIPTEITCSIHPWMSCRMLVRPDPYFAVTAADGTFEIKDLPAGDHEFSVWHEKAGYISKIQLDGKATTWDKGRFKRKVVEGDNDLGEIKASATLFK
ncbi:MAG: hypothetical protein SGJ20_16460 [Planctomycetota bacterium]|nr:hypothetical protein [Planctomycetota bacterium]